MGKRWLWGIVLKWGKRGQVGHQRKGRRQLGCLKRRAGGPAVKGRRQRLKKNRENEEKKGFYVGVMVDWVAIL